ncbi:hypothetical protein M011DRAFT_467890 [Sporormia fimetaria CBS 119925]|uniref:Uncharacterized protein n=1 Tax=Sporormia fimetaria CBS 119925 TaxID=1340428 RepID=A0A6A6V9V0_9PLEO|nr:hypothetical protein M011DRAFT_467890 [Sporormia fimetaria CBS 119925]
MLVRSPYLVLTILTALSGALPVDPLAPRSRTYAVVNVDGGPTAPPQATTTLLQSTTMIVVPVAPTPSSSSTSTSSSTSPTPKRPKSSPSPTPTSTRTSSTPVITVVVTETAQPTEFYDDGLWKTYYPVKNFDEVATTSTTSSTSTSSTTPSPSPFVSYNHTEIVGRRAVPYHRPALSQFQ